jgi:hypothetical protein
MSGHLRSDHNSGRTGAGRGNPVSSSRGARYRISLTAAVTSRRNMRFTSKEKGRVNAEFVRRLHVQEPKQDFSNR